MPTAVLITGPGSLGARTGMRLGHFAAGRWVTVGDAPLGEVFVAGEVWRAAPRTCWPRCCTRLRMPSLSIVA